MVKFIGIDNLVIEENEGDSHKILESVQFDRCKLHMFCWDRAIITLNAMLIVDCLDAWAYNQICSGIERLLLVFGWKDGH